MPILNIDREKELLLQVVDGDETAFRSLYNLYERLLYPFLTDLTKSEGDTSDLIQETMLRLWLNREQIRHIENPRAYVYKIASNLAFTWLKAQLARRRREQKIQLEDRELPEIYSGLNIISIRQIVNNAINKMPPQRRKIYILNREHNMKISEIARKLAVSESTVKNTLSQATKFIREQVEKAGYFLPLWAIEFFFGKI